MFAWTPKTLAQALAACAARDKHLCALLSRAHDPTVRRSTHSARALNSLLVRGLLLRAHCHKEPAA